jgi:hypothetical protein
MTFIAIVIGVALGLGIFSGVYLVGLFVANLIDEVFHQ